MKQERNAYDQPGNLVKDYVPRDWDIDERSELYSVGLIILSLTKAHKLAIAQQESETKYLANTWLTSLSREGSEIDGGRGPSSLDELEPQYSVRLYQTLARCLMTRPNDRCSLDELKNIVDQERQRIDRQYGAKLKRSYDEMDEDLKVHITEERQNSRGLAIGTRFSPPNKRRKVRLDELSDELRTFITNMATDWNDNYTKLGKNELIPIIHDFHAQYNKGTGFMEESPEDVAMRYLVSTLYKHVSRSLPVCVYRGTDRDIGFMNALATRHRRSVLEHVLNNVLPDVGLSDSASPDAARILEHAIRWGIGLIDANGESREIRLMEPSVLHLAVRQFVFKTPSGAFVGTEAGSSGGNQEV